MWFLLNGAEHKVELYGSYVLVDNTQFSLKGKNWNEAHHRNSHVYTFDFKTRTMEIGKDYQAWYDEDQLPVSFLEWTRRKSNRNIKNIIIHGNVYQIKNASCSWPHPSLYLNKEHVGYVIEDNELVWIGKNGKLQFQKTIR